MDVSPAAESRIRLEAARLERYCDRITGCRVVVEAPHRHPERGNGFHVSIDLRVPGSEIVVAHGPSLHSALSRGGAAETKKQLEPHPDHNDIYVSIRDAFAAARRRLEDYVRLLRGDVKHHSATEEVSDAG